MPDFLNLLPKETAKLWQKLSTEKLLGKAILIGGTALTLRIGHRQSEDLDFSFQSLKLPTKEINALLKKYPKWERNDNQASYEEFLIGGGSLHDHQQDFITEKGVKVTFFAEDVNAWPLIKENNSDYPTVATTKEIFALKALVSAKRSSSRDWFDLYTLIKDHGFTLADMAAAFKKSRQTSSFDIAMNRLCTGIVGPADPGYAPLCSDPPSIEEITAFFRDLRSKYEIELSKALSLKGKAGKK
jgi:hypothetical protein